MRRRRLEEDVDAAEGGFGEAGGDEVDGVVVAAGHYHFFESRAATEHVRCLNAASGRDVPAGEVEGGKGGAVGKHFS